MNLLAKNAALQEALSGSLNSTPEIRWLVRAARQESVQQPPRLVFQAN